MESDLVGLSDEELTEHMERASEYFDEMASKTNGVLTYYYRIDPEVSKNVKGFWYVDLDGEGFVRQAEDMFSQLVDRMKQDEGVT